MQSIAAFPCASFKGDKNKTIATDVNAKYLQASLLCRDAPRVKNPGGQVVLGGNNVSPLVDIGLTDPPKSGGAAAPPASQLVACLICTYNLIWLVWNEQKI